MADEFGEFFQEENNNNNNENIDDLNNNDYNEDTFNNNNGNFDNNILNQQPNQQNAKELNKGNDEPTFLSVWQEQRRVELEKRAAAESAAQKKLVEEAQDEIKQFHITRQKKIETIRKENREKEKIVREDLQATFQHGTTWEQVGKMVNLQENKNANNDPNEGGSDRMRTLLLQLKNAKR